MYEVYLRQNILLKSQILLNIAQGQGCFHDFFFLLHIFPMIQDNISFMNPRFMLFIGSQILSCFKVLLHNLTINNIAFPYHFISGNTPNSSEKIQQTSNILWANLVTYLDLITYLLTLTLSLCLKKKWQQWKDRYEMGIWKASF